MMRRVAAMGLAVALLAGACGDDDDGGASDPPATPDATFLALLDGIPDTDETRRYVILNDFAAARDAAGVEQPDADADEDDLLEYALLITGGRLDEVEVATLPAMIGHSSNAMEEDWRGELGFGLSDLDGDAYAGEPPDTIQLFEGRIDAGAVDDAVSDDETWSDVLEEESHADVDYYSWGDERDSDRVTPVRPIGVGGALLVDEPVAVFTQNPETMEEAIDVQTGDEPSLADDEDFVDVATAMTDLGAYSAILSDEPIEAFPDPSMPQEEFEEFEEFVDEFALEPYSAYAIGGGLDDDGPYLAVALVHDDPQTAAENADALEHLVEEGISARDIDWAELLEVDEITTDGAVMTARLGILDAPPSLWNRIVNERDNLLATAG